MDFIFLRKLTKTKGPLSDLWKTHPYLTHQQWPQEKGVFFWAGVKTETTKQLSSSRLDSHPRNPEPGTQPCLHEPEVVALGVGAQQLGGAALLRGQRSRERGEAQHEPQLDMPQTCRNLVRGRKKTRVNSFCAELTTYDLAACIGARALAIQFARATLQQGGGGGGCAGGGE